MRCELIHDLYTYNVKNNNKVQDQVIHIHILFDRRQFCIANDIFGQVGKWALNVSVLTMIIDQ